MVEAHGERSKLVDSTFIDNAAAAHVAAALRLKAGAAPAGKAYFITNGEPRPMKDLLNGILRAAGLPPVVRTVSPAFAYAAGAVLEGLHGILRLAGVEAEPRMTRFVARQLATAHWFDISAARRDLGYEPRVSVAEGMLRLEAWLAASPAALEATR
jgi:nucleoside-diphosphate-sugar epimerase